MTTFYDSIWIYPSDKRRAMEEEVETFAGSSPLEMEAVGSWGGGMGCTITTTRTEVQRGSCTATACWLALSAELEKQSKSALLTVSVVGFCIWEE